jgi:membrane-bound serine protease (ClpP class)
MTAVGVVLLVVGAILAMSEAHNPTHGIAGSGGVAVMAIGIALALAGVGAGLLLGVGSGVVLAAAGGGAVALTVNRSVAVRHRRVRGGAEGLIGQLGVVRGWQEAEGRVLVQGAVWQARRSPNPDEQPHPALHAGDRVVVERLSGLTLWVRGADEWELE